MYVRYVGCGLSLLGRRKPSDPDANSSWSQLPRAAKRGRVVPDSFPTLLLSEWFGGRWAPHDAGIRCVQGALSTREVSGSRSVPSRSLL